MRYRGERCTEITGLKIVYINDFINFSRQIDTNDLVVFTSKGQWLPLAIR